MTATEFILPEYLVQLDGACAAAVWLSRVRRCIDKLWKAETHRARPCLVECLKNALGTLKEESKCDELRLSKRARSVWVKGLACCIESMLIELKASSGDGLVYFIEVQGSRPIRIKVPKARTHIRQKEVQSLKLAKGYGACLVRVVEPVESMDGGAAYHASKRADFKLAVSLHDRKSEGNKSQTTAAIPSCDCQERVYLLEGHPQVSCRRLVPKLKTHLIM